VRELARNPVMLAEARQALPQLRAAATAPAGEDGVRRVIGRRLVTFPQARMNDAQWAAWWESYYETCADLAEEALEAGMAAWVRDPQSQWMPKPGKLRELALSTPNRAARAYGRVTAALRLVEERDGRRSGSPVDRENLSKLMADFRARMSANRPQEPEKPKSQPIHGETDESGLTAAMREVLGR